MTDGESAQNSNGAGSTPANNTRVPNCPDCGPGTRVIPIVWGGPAPGDAAAVARDEIELGGCVLPEGHVPHWRCRGCSKAF